jgi:predicted nucleic acid-binding protein
MPGLFLDTAGWFAAMSPREMGHQVARDAYANAASRGVDLVTTPFVIAEVHTLIIRWRTSGDGRRFLSMAMQGEAHRVITPDAELIRAAVDRWIDRYHDHPFSLCDAISFEVMRRERLSRALTFDRHFVVAGFEIL